MSRAAEWRLLERTGALFAQLFFIAAGVYLGNQADDWKQEREHRAAARAALQNFRTEFAANRRRWTAAVPTYDAYLDSMATSRKRGDPPPQTVREAFRRLGWHGMNPVGFTHTAWDLALATQSLSYLPSPLAFSVARVYASQERVQAMQNQATTELFAPTSLDDAHVFPWLISLGGYLEDMHIAGPQMTKLYDQSLASVDSALATTPR